MLSGQRLRRGASVFPAYRAGENLRKAIPGGNLVLSTKLKTLDQRLAYAHRALEHERSRHIQLMQIESRLLEREGRAITIFAAPNVSYLKKYLFYDYFWAMVTGGRRIACLMCFSKDRIGL